MPGIALFIESGMSCIRRALQSASLCNGTLPKSAFWRFVTVFGADSLSETDRYIATRQNKMAAPDVVSAHFKKLNVCMCARARVCVRACVCVWVGRWVCFVLGQSALC